MTRDELLALLIERSKLAGTFSEGPHFQAHLDAEVDALLASEVDSQVLKDNNVRWREHYERLGRPHKHIPVAEVK